MLSRIVQERDVLNGEFQRTALQERQYATAYLAKDQDSADAVRLRQLFGDGSRAYLEEQSVLGYRLANPMALTMSRFTDLWATLNGL